ncbi:MAG TPA: hypothetical protein VI544_00290 [Candidatus Nanoarchaeia archaeon]|nr:hypothetical protein [Candidatus Nanoarchaeia archaeon]
MKKEKEIMEKEQGFIRKEMNLIRKEIKLISGFDYPKLAGLVIAIIAAYFIFSNPQIAGYVSKLNGLGYLGVFIAGLFFTFGFTAPFAAGFFITLNPENIWLAAFLGGFGAMLGDLLIFKFIRFSFIDEFQRLENTRVMRKTSSLIDRTLGHKIKIYIMYALAGLLIASPLPDEAGVILLAGLTRIKANILAIISFIMNTLGILILLYI